MPKAEKKVENSLTRLGLEVYLPLQQKIVQWSDRKKKILVPIFPGYVFVCLNDLEINKIYNVPGVLYFVSTAGKKSIISNQKMSIIKTLLTEGTAVGDTKLRLGQHVEIVRGPLMGFRGRLAETKGKCRLVVALDFIKQKVMVEISKKDIIIKQTHVDYSKKSHELTV